MTLYTTQRYIPDIWEELQTDAVDEEDRQMLGGRLTALKYLSTEDSEETCPSEYAQNMSELTSDCAYNMSELTSECAYNMSELTSECAYNMSELTSECACIQNV
jgi:hypothetical protein